MSRIRSTNNFWFCWFVAGCLILATVGIILDCQYTARRNTHMVERCHEVPGHDYLGCMERAKKEYKE